MTTATEAREIMYDGLDKKVDTVLNGILREVKGDAGDGCSALDVNIPRCVRDDVIDDLRDLGFRVKRNWFAMDRHFEVSWENP